MQWECCLRERHQDVVLGCSRAFECCSSRTISNSSIGLSGQSFWCSTLCGIGYKVLEWCQLLLCQSLFWPKKVEIKFLNQVQGRTVNNAALDSTIRNNIDNGKHCSKKGPSVFAVCPPVHHNHLGSSLIYFTKQENLPQAFSRINNSNKSQHEKKLQKILASGIV